jgi:hypothetical protein
VARATAAALVVYGAVVIAAPQILPTFTSVGGIANHDRADGHADARERRPALGHAAEAGLRAFACSLCRAHEAHAARTLPPELGIQGPGAYRGSAPAARPDLKKAARHPSSMLFPRVEKVSCSQDNSR